MPHPHQPRHPARRAVLAAQAGKVLPLLARFFEQNFQTKPFQRLLGLLMGCGGQGEERGDPRLILAKFWVMSHSDACPLAGCRGLGRSGDIGKELTIGPEHVPGHHVMGQKLE